MINVNDFLWVEKYRPRKLDDVILPKIIKDKFRGFIEQNRIPNLILAGGAGVGKTTVARAMLEEIDAEYMILNGSLESGIDMLRNEIIQFASTMSMSGQRKYVIFDEADNLGPAIQKALRNFIEKYTNNCGWILTCNFKEKLIPPLHSRCVPIDFDISKKDKPKIAKEFFVRISDILVKENVEFEKKAVVNMIVEYFPDFRRVIGELETIAISGDITELAVEASGRNDIDPLIDLMKQGEYLKAVHWLSDNKDLNSAYFYKSLYDKMAPRLSGAASIAGVNVMLAKYEYRESFVAIVEINRSALAAEIMQIADWKK